MALVWVIRQPFVTTVIIGATTMDQLEADLGSTELVLPEKMIGEIELIHSFQPNPDP